MKEFEKWWLKRCKAKWGFEGSIESKGFEFDWEVWKAALEWALSTKTQIDWRFGDIILPETIEKELENERI